VNAQGRIERPSGEDDDAEEETDEEEARDRIGFDRLRAVSDALNKVHMGLLFCIVILALSCYTTN
jgi:hypothetical protein